MATFLELIEGLQTLYLRVPGLPAYNGQGTTLADCVNISYGQPASVDATPYLYTLFDRSQEIEQGTIMAKHYRIVSILLVPWQDNQAAELQLAPFITSLPEALEANCQLQGLTIPTALIPDGRIICTDVDAVFRKVGGQIFRSLDFTLDLLIKRKRLTPFD